MKNYRDPFKKVLFPLTPEKVTPELLEEAKAHLPSAYKCDENFGKIIYVFSFREDDFSVVPAVIIGYREDFDNKYKCNVDVYTYVKCTEDFKGFSRFTATELEVFHANRFISFSNDPEKALLAYKNYLISKREELEKQIDTVCQRHRNVDDLLTNKNFDVFKREN